MIFNFFTKQRKEIAELREINTKMINTFAVLIDYLGIDCETARKGAGRPADVFIKAIEENTHWKLHGKHIIEYPGDVFVVFDPTTGGAHIAGASRTIEEAIRILQKCV